MKKGFENAFDFKVAYVFTVDDDLHRGKVKIGDATLHTMMDVDKLNPNSHELNQAAMDRIKQYTNTLGAKVKLLHTELGVKTVKDDSGNPQIKSFRDHEVHRVLKNSGINNVKVGDSTGVEWFDIDIETAKKAIEAVKTNKKNLSDAKFSGVIPIVFRPEQEDAIERVVKHFKKADTFLMNAKMRFGKTFVSLEIVKECKFQKTLILTHRPVVDSGWYDDFTKIFQDTENYIYGSKNKGYSVEALLDSGKNFIYFASIQDLRGSEEVGGKHDKNQTVFSTKWDCVIVDEAHEGTTTTLGEETVKAVVKEGTKFLALSGTPFNIMDNYDDDSIYTWDYIMEQECKSEWDKNHFGDSNPYDELPELRIFTYDLGDSLNNKNYITYDDKAFNFKEFFRTWTGEYDNDHANMPASAEIGDFVHEDDVKSFLNLMTSKKSDSDYPYATEEYRNIFKHSLWMVPGVKEAKALKKLMLKHPVFGSGAFDIVNVAGNGDKDEESDDALQKVRSAIKKAGEGYTITLSCGKLTTGVTVREWTAVLMLSGTYSTSAANYLQTIFRVQSPCNMDGKIKDKAYVFDFAPDRTLKMVAEAVSVSTKAGRTDDDQRKMMAKMLNFCPVISVSGSKMQEYTANKLLQQLKRAYADRVVRNGFDDSNLYSDELFMLDDVDIQRFDDLKGIIGKTKALPKANDITVNDQGLTNEQYEEKKKLEKKKKKDLTPEEIERLEELKKIKKLRNDAISILRGISIRMPLLIYGADIPYEDEITIDKFVDLVDDSSWEEFMPNGVTKKRFNEFKKYYDEDVFLAAGRRIRNVAREADELDPLERVKKISSLFKYFKNPDKETVLTPWRVVNMHMSDCVGGWCFYNEDFDDDIELDEPRYVKQGKVTSDVFDGEDPKILELNSKTGLYPLYMTFSVYMSKCKRDTGRKLTDSDKKKIWFDVVKNNIYVICKTPMAKTITARTLIGYKNETVNAHYFDDLINTMENKSKSFIDKILRESYWKKGNGKMKFDAIVGNPPYQAGTGGGSETTAATQAKPIYQLFVSQAMKLEPDYLSMIIPAKWYNGGIGLSSFRFDMLNDSHIQKLVDYSNSKELFPTVDIGGGICYFLWNQSYNDDCTVVNSLLGKKSESVRKLNQFEDFFVRYNEAISIIEKVKNKADLFVDSIASSIDTFGIPSSNKGHKDYQDGDILLLHSVGANSQGTDYIRPDEVTKNRDLIDKFKIKISILVPQNGEVGISPEKGYRSISSPQILYPGTVDTFSYLNIGFFDTEKEAMNFREFITSKFARFMLRITFSSSHISQGNFTFVPMMDFKESWNDEKLYAYFGLDEDEKQIIDGMMRPLILEKDDIGKEFYEKKYLNSGR